MANLYSHFFLTLQKKAAGENEKPALIKTHLRNMVIIPEMIGSVIGVYNGKVFLTVEVRVRAALPSCCFRMIDWWTFLY